VIRPDRCVLIRCPEGGGRVATRPQQVRIRRNPAGQRVPRNPALTVSTGSPPIPEGPGVKRREGSVNTDQVCREQGRTLEPPDAVRAEIPAGRDLLAAPTPTRRPTSYPGWRAGVDDPRRSRPAGISALTASGASRGLPLSPTNLVSIHRSHSPADSGAL